MSQNENTVKNSEILFIYEAENTNPNGDPDNENKPRKDSRGFVEVTDLRLKRFIRDYMEEQGKTIVVRPDVVLTNNDGTVEKDNKGLEKKASNMGHLIVEAAKKAQLSFEKDATNEDKEKKFLETFKDIAYFGIVPGDARSKHPYLKFNYYGAVQFQYGRSFNKAEIETYTISPVAETLGVDHRLKYGVIGFYGVVNAKTAANNKLINDDIVALDKYVINGVPQMSKLSRSKLGHNSLFYLRIEYKAGYNPKDLRRFVSIDKTEKIYGTEDFQLDIDKLIEFLESNKEYIEKLHYWCSDDLQIKDGKEIKEIKEIKDTVDVDISEKNTQ